jgi:sulfur-carrier protein adenylyltransferase/sulfurtransferase
MNGPVFVPSPQGKTFQQLVTEAKAIVEEITVDTLKDWVTDRRALTIIDVREAIEYQHGCIPNAVSLPRGILELEIDEVVTNAEQAIVVYCGGGSRSALAAQTLGIMGYTKVYSLTGGFRAWQAELTR